MNEFVSKSVVAKRTGLPLPIYARATIYGLVWLPFLGLVAFFVPRFEGLFSRLREQGLLPAITEWLLWFSLLNRALVFFPCLLLAILLVVTDVGVAGLLRRSRLEWLYWVWFIGVVAMGILAVAIGATALLLPVLEMSGSV